MLENFLNKLSYLGYYIFYVRDIDLEDKEIEEYEIENKPYMVDSVKYFIWRKIALLFLIPGLILDFILTILCYQNSLDKFGHKDSNVSENLYGHSFKNETQHIIEFMFPKKTEDFIILYSTMSCIILCIQLIYILLSLVYHKLWYSTSKWIRYAFVLSVLWVYIVFLNPVQDYLKIVNHNEKGEKGELYSYSYVLILCYLFKEIIPISLALIDGIFWSSFNMKYLYPKNRLVGHFYNLGSWFYIMTVGLILLVVNQLFNNYLISVTILFSICGYLIPYISYKSKIIFYYEEEDLELKDLIRDSFLIKNIFFLLGLLLVIIYCFDNKNPFMVGIYEVQMIDVLHLAIKLCHRYVFYKILLGDTLFGLILQDAKFNILYQEQMKLELKKLRDTENQLYIRSFY